MEQMSTMCSTAARIGVQRLQLQHSPLLYRTAEQHSRELQKGFTCSCCEYLFKIRCCFK